MSGNLLEEFNETPISYGIVLAYVALAYLTQSLGMNSDLNALITYGASAGLLVQDGEPWRLLSSAFLHGNVLHLGLNAFALMQLGPPLERYMGPLRFSLLYIVAAATCSLLALYFNDPHVPLVGGSGALFGMIGAAIAFSIRGGSTLLDFLDNQSTRSLIATAAFYLLAGLFIPVVSNSGHFGGLVGGFVLVFCFLDRGRREETDGESRAIQAGWIALFLGLLCYQLQPVLRMDYNIRQFLTTKDPQARAEHRVFLEIREGIYSHPGLIEESEPKTGIPAIHYRESLLYKDIPRYAETLRAWKTGR